MSALPPLGRNRQGGQTNGPHPIRESLEFPEGRFDPRNGPGASRHSISVLIVSLIRPMSSLGNVVISDNTGQPCGRFALDRHRRPPGGLSDLWFPGACLTSEDVLRKYY